MTIDGCALDKVLRVYPDTYFEDENLGDYAALDEPLTATIKKERGRMGYYLEIRKQAEKCQNTHKP